MRSISNQVRQRRRQTWLDLPAHRIEEADHGSRSENPLSEDCGEEKEPTPPVARGKGAACERRSPQRGELLDINSRTKILHPSLKLSPVRSHGIEVKVHPASRFRGECV